MTKQFDDEFQGKANHKKDHKKRHKPGFNESQDIMTQRHTRISFKNYLRDLKEQEALEDLEDEDELNFDDEVETKNEEL